MKKIKILTTFFAIAFGFQTYSTEYKEFYGLDSEKAKQFFNIAENQNILIKKEKSSDSKLLSIEISEKTSNIAQILFEINKKNRSANLKFLLVKATLRKQGFGSKLFAWMKDYCKAKKCTSIDWNISYHDSFCNPEEYEKVFFNAITFYTKQGAEIVNQFFNEENPADSMAYAYLGL